ncbi:MAG: hypothetical protein RIQ89_205 [Bacteroidota bacterium]|jgi:ATP-dependent RNA helicase DeaD
MATFDQYGLNPSILDALTDLNFKTPTPIQQEAIPALLAGDRDFIGLAQTGTGKTAAFGLPLCNLINVDDRRPQALILAPTRELCVQIANDILQFTKYLPGFSTVAVYGGASIETQIRQLKKGAHVVVATPGRLIDLLHRKAANLGGIRYFILDEADEMLNMGFREEIEEILSFAGGEKHTWLFSATMPPEVRQIIGTYLTNPLELRANSINTTAENITHKYYVVHERDRYKALKRIVDATPEIFAIVFCRTKIQTQDIAEQLIKDGYNADALHGDLSQPQRDKVMGRYRNRSLQILVATDVAARGIDVSDVTHVVHYYLPDEAENYTHRSGRTARAGKKGESLVLVNTKEVFKIKQLEQKIKAKIHLSKVPDALQIGEQQLMKLVHKLHKVEIDEKGIEQFLPTIFEELKELDRDELIKRIVSIEFNRFLDYYRDADDVNVDLAHAGKRSQAGRGGNDRYSINQSRLFLSLGTVDGFDKGKMLGYILDNAEIPKEAVGRMDLSGVYSHIDIDDQYATKVVEALNGEVYRGRKVRADMATPKAKKTRPSGGGGSRGSDRGDRGGRRSDYDQKPGNRRSGGGDFGGKKSRGWGEQRGRR